MEQQVRVQKAQFSGVACQRENALLSYKKVVLEQVTVQKYNSWGLLAKKWFGYLLKRKGLR